MALKEREYDEDLEELLGEEYSELDEEETEEEVEEEYTEETATKEVSFDTEIEKNISSFITWASAIKWLMIITGVIMFIISIANDSAIVGIVMFITFVICGFLYSMFFKWFGYVLKCLHDIKNK